MNKIYEPHKSSLFDLNANIVIIIIWWGATIINLIGRVRFLSFIIPLLFLLLEKKSPLVREHAGQALAITIITSIVSFISTVITAMATGFGFLFIAIGALFAVFMVVFTIATFVCTIIATVKGLGYEEFSIPLIGPFGEVLADKINIIN